MWNIRKKLGLIFRTLNSIGYRRLFYKNLFILKLKVFSFLPYEISLFLIGYTKCRLKFRKEFSVISQLKVFKERKTLPFNYIDISLIDNEYRFFIPIPWQVKSGSRLLNFYLHYFDWIRVYINCLLNNKNYKLSTFEIDYLIDSWIDNNKFAKGDGWHPYTTSLRIMNWSILFQIFPRFLTKKRINSLFKQLLWLNTNLEKAQGGNHLIENLIAICIVSFQFDNNKAKNIFRNSLRNLNYQLNLQMLNDGGHFERSATYHTILLDRLIELGCFICIAEGSSPSWLNSKIEEMSNWLRKVSFLDEKLPRFNDSALNSSPSVNKVIYSADIFLQKSMDFKNANLTFLRSLLLEKALNKSKKISTFPSKKNQNESLSRILDLPDTGWVIFKPGLGWESSFKNGVATCYEAPGHCQSDLLSFDLLFNGEYIFVDAGTSEYETGKTRDFERSGEAHNVLQIGKKNKKWIEPVEVWNDFKVGRISKNINRKYGITKGGELFALGSYDSYKNIGAYHNRKIELSEVTSNSIKLKIEDRINSKNRIYCRLIFHLGPKINYKKVLNSLTITTNPNIKHQININQTSFSEGFEHSEFRSSIYCRFTLEKGHYLIRSIINIESSFLLSDSFEEGLVN